MSYENTNYHKRSVLMRMSLHVGNMLDQASKDNHVTKALIIRLAATMVEPGELAAKNKKPFRAPRFRTGHTDWKDDKQYRSVPAKLSDAEYELVSRAAVGMDMARGPWLALKVEQLLSSPRLRELLEDATYKKPTRRHRTSSSSQKAADNDPWKPFSTPRCLNLHRRCIIEE